MFTWNKFGPLGALRENEGGYSPSVTFDPALGQPALGQPAPGQPAPAAGGTGGASGFNTGDPAFIQWAQSLTPSALTAVEMQQAQQQADASLAEQRREFDISTKQTESSLSWQKDLQKQQQDQVDQQAALTKQWQTGRAANLDKATQAVNAAFAAFTPDYYKQFARDYTAHYQPEMDRQYATASNNMLFGLARTGNTASQTAADQRMNLEQTKGVAESDLNSQAVSAANDLQSRTAQAKQNLTGAATSDATIGSPIAPGSADAVTANFNNATAAINNLRTSAGDTVTTLQAIPQYSSLGNVFSNLASTGAAAINGNNAFGYYQAFQNGMSRGASNPTAKGSGSTRG